MNPPIVPPAPRARHSCSAGTVTTKIDRHFQWHPDQTGVLTRRDEKSIPTAHLLHRHHDSIQVQEWSGLRAERTTPGPARMNPRAAAKIFPEIRA